MQKEKKFSPLQKSKIAAFTLLEALVALLVIASSLLLFEGLSRNLAYDMRYQSQDVRKDWLVFSEQLRQELDQSQFVKIEQNRLFVKKSGQELAFGQSKKDDFRKTNWSLQGYQPMLQGLEQTTIVQTGTRVDFSFIFETGLERSFVYDIKNAD